MTLRWMMIVSGALLAGAGSVSAGDKTYIVRDLDLGLGASLSFGRAEHQASHKIWGTALDETGKYQAIELE